MVFFTAMTTSSFPPHLFCPPLSACPVFSFGVKTVQREMEEKEEKRADHGPGKEKRGRTREREASPPPRPPLRDAGQPRLQRLRDGAQRRQRLRINLESPADNLSRPGALKDRNSSSAAAESVPRTSSVAAAGDRRCVALPSDSVRRRAASSPRRSALSLTRERRSPWRA